MNEVQKSVNKKINVTNVTDAPSKGLDGTNKPNTLKSDLEGALATSQPAKKTSLTSTAAGGVLLANQREQDNRSQGASEQSDNISQSGDRAKSKRGALRRGRPGDSQVSTSGFKLREQNLGKDNYHALQQHFQKICGKDNTKLLPRELQRFLSSVYPGALGKNINHAINTKITAKGIAFNFNNAMNDVEFFKQLESIFNVDEAGFKDFAFMIFDTNNDDKISELDLQELMKASSQ